MARVDEVPSWVYFPDRERSEWLNKILKQLWPNLRVYLSNVFVEQVEPIINQYSMAFIGKMRFDEVDLGDIVCMVLILIKR
jgi:Ca2+-dependent lipid-binding protein